MTCGYRRFSPWKGIVDATQHGGVPWLGGCWGGGFGDPWTSPPEGLRSQLGKIPFASHCLPEMNVGEGYEFPRSMRQLELRYAARCGDAEGVEGRFELEIADPDALWSLEPSETAPRRWALHAGPEGLRIRAGACLDADARVRMTAARCAGLVAGRRPRPEALDVTGAADRAAALLDLLAPPRAVAAAA